MNNNMPQRTNAYSPWNPSPANNYTHTYTPQQPVERKTMGNASYCPSVPNGAVIFTNVVKQPNKK